jgi:Zn finger protein HypA/HybF involved in hydrogenase expression
MCSCSGPILAEINPEGIGFRKYQCRSCGRSLKASGRYPECPECGSEDLELV